MNAGLSAINQKRLLLLGLVGANAVNLGCNGNVHYHRLSVFGSIVTGSSSVSVGWPDLPFVALLTLSSTHTTQSFVILLPTTTTTTTMSSNSLEPETKPPTTLGSAKALATRLYPQLVAITLIKELVSYDDRNYLLTAADGSKYVLKITNSVDSAPEGMLEGQNSMMLHLHNRHYLQVPLPILNIHSAYITRERFKPSGPLFAIRLLKFVPGTRLFEHQMTTTLLTQCGHYLGHLQAAINDGHYTSSAIQARKYLWSLECVPELRKYLYVFDADQQKQQWIRTALDDFDAEVVTKMEQLPKAYIHGDFNEQNILVNEGQVDAVIDFGDICYVPRVFDIAILIAYLMLLDTSEVDPVLVGPKLVLSGFLKHIKLSSEELSLLLICSAGRLVQSLTLGMVTYLQQPGNEYLLTTQEKGWKVMKRLAEVDKKRLVEKWVKEIEEEEEEEQ